MRRITRSPSGVDVSRRPLPPAHPPMVRPGLTATTECHARSASRSRRADTTRSGGRSGESGPWSPGPVPVGSVDEPRASGHRRSRWCGVPTPERAGSALLVVGLGHAAGDAAPLGDLVALRPRPFREWPCSARGRRWWNRRPAGRWRARSPDVTPDGPRCGAPTCGGRGRRNRRAHRAGSPRSSRRGRSRRTPSSPNSNRPVGLGLVDVVDERDNGLLGHERHPCCRSGRCGRETARSHRSRMPTFYTIGPVGAASPACFPPGRATSRRSPHGFRSRLSTVREFRGSPFERDRVVTVDCVPSRFRGGVDTPGDSSPDEAVAASARDGLRHAPFRVGQEDADGGHGPPCCPRRRAARPARSSSVGSGPRWRKNTTWSLHSRRSSAWCAGIGPEASTPRAWSRTSQSWQNGQCSTSRPHLVTTSASSVRSSGGERQGTCRCGNEGSVPRAAG